MMWGDPQAATSVPRGLPGRGTTAAPSGEIVEAQSYWTPDPMEATPEELDLLAQLRPDVCTWPRRVVVPLPTVDDAGEPIEEKGRYNDWRDAPYELAEDHPELEDYVPEILAPTGEPTSIQEQARADRPEDQDPYGPELTARAGDLESRLGSLLQIDADLDLWAVIETVDEDVLDPDAVAVCWRSDDDGGDYGVLVLSSSDLVAVRDLTEDPQEAEGTEAA